MTSDKVLDTKLVREIIENPDKNKVMFTPPIQPKAGEVYVFSTGGNPENVRINIYGLTKVVKEFQKTQSHYGNYGIRYHCTRVTIRVLVGFLVVNQVVNQVL